jgi:hypothetical protein
VDMHESGEAWEGTILSAMFSKGRVIIPCGGCTSRRSKTEKKRPWYITLKVNEPIFMAGLTNFRPESQQGVETGFVIVAKDSGAGMVMFTTEGGSAIRSMTLTGYEANSCTKERFLILIPISPLMTSNIMRILRMIFKGHPGTPSMYRRNEAISLCFRGTV